MLQFIFSVLIILQFVVIVIHDWLHIPGLTHGRQVRAALGMTKMLLGTAISLVLSGTAAWFAVAYWGRPPSLAAKIYWTFYCPFTVMGALSAWWVPYFRGTDEKTKQLYAAMYAGTIQVLPPRGDNPRPNLLHLFFHALFVTTLILAVALWFV